MPVKIIQSAEWPAIRDAIKPMPCLWEPLLPAHSVTILHGAGGSGKSGLLYGLGNAVEEGVPFLGLPVTKGRVLLISTDMNLFAIKQRWKSDFIPKFDFLCPQPYDCIDARFRTTDLYKTVKEYTEAQGTSLIMIDALSSTLGVHEINGPETANGWYVAIKEWFPNAAVLFLHHDRKAHFAKDGKLLPQSGQNSMGSAYWYNNAVSQIHMWPMPNQDHVSIVKHSKAQTTDLLLDPLKVYINTYGIAESWIALRADEGRDRYLEAISKLNLNGESPQARDAAVAKFHHVSERTARRWRSL